MYAPSGVDSDTSSGEPDIPDSPPKEFGNKPHFSLKSLFQPARKLIDPLRKPDGADDVKQLRAVQAVEAESTPAKKRVRIVVDGEPEEPFKTLRSPREPMDQAFGKARLSPVIQNEATTSGPRPNESSAELLTTLRELIAESATNRQTLLPAQPPSNERRESPTFLHPIPKRRPTPFQPASERSSELESDARREQTSPLLTMKPERGHPQLRGQPSRPGNLELRYDTDPDVDAPSAGQAPEVGDPVPTQLAKPSHGHIPWLALRTPPSHADDSRAPPSLHTKEITSAPPVDQLYLSTAGEQAIPPLSYQPLRAYHLPRNGSSPQVYHPAEGDQWTQPGSAPPSHQHPRHDPSREACSHQPPPFENAAPSLHFYYQAQYAYPSNMQHGYTAQQSFYAGHPPPTYVLVQPPPISPYMISPPSPVYFQTVSLQRWQPYYPTLPDSNAQYPLSQHASVHETEYSFHREPASAPVRPSEPWPSGGNDQRLDRSPMPQSDLESNDRIRRHVAAGAELHHPTTGEGWSGDMQGKVISPREQNASALGPESEVYPPNPARPNAESARRTDGNHATSRTPSELSSPTRQKLDSPRIVVKTAEGIREVEPYRSPSRVSPRNGEADDVLADKKRASSSASPGKRTNPAVTASKPAAKDEKRRKAHETTQETEEESKVEGGPLYKAKTTITSSHRDEERERARRNGQKRAMLQAEASEEKTEQWQAERTDDGRICEREKAYALTKPNTKQKALLDAKDAAKQGVSRLPGEGRVEVRESQKNFDVDGSAKREAKRRVLLKAEVAKQLKQGSSDLAPEEVEPDQREEMARRGATKRAMIEAILSKETKASRSSVKETTHESDERDRAADGDTARRREKQRALLKANAAAEGETPQTADHRNKVDEKKRRREAGDHGTARNEAERRAMLRAVAGDGPACKIRMQYREDRSRTSVTDEDKDRARREAKRKALMEAKAAAESRTSRSYQQDIGSQNDERRVNIYYEGETKKADRRKILIEDDEALERPKARLTANDKPKLEEVRSRGADVRSQGFEDWDAAVKQEKQKMMAASETEKMRGCGGPDSLLKPTEATTTHDRVTRSRNDAAQDLGRYTDMRTSMKKDGRPIDPAAKKDKVDHAQALSQAIGGDPKSGHLTWSKCLVSLATCIGKSFFLSADYSLTPPDLANRLLSHLMASRSGKRGSQLSPILVEVLPRLLSSLLMQMDIVETMREVFGDDHSDSMGMYLTEDILTIPRRVCETSKNH
jgi:hypothetical protein